MAFSDIFGKKPVSEQKAALPTGTPSEEVIALRRQGVGNSQIMQTLQARGYSLVQINDAFSQADLKSGGQSFQATEGDKMADNQMQFQQPTFMDNPQAQPQFQMPQPQVDVSRIEEIAEAIIDEKWEDLIKNIEKVVSWKDKVEARIITIEQQIKQMKDDFDKLHTSLLEKINDYDQNIVNVGTDIKALEQVFKRVLPNFVENVSELSRITDTLKKSGVGR